MRISLLCVCIAAAVCAHASPSPAAQNGYPSRQIEIIVPFAAGGGLDVATRILAKYAEPELGQNINVVNKTQGGNIQGNLLGVRAEPDGYTLGSWASGLATDELIIKNAPYTHRDVQPICVFAIDPGIITISAEFARDHNIATLADLVRHVGEYPLRVTIGMGGNWTTHDFLRLKLEAAAGIKFNRMPFLGGAPAIKATATGNCNVATPFLSELLPWLKTGEVLPLAVAWNARLEQIPDVPTVAEAGYPGVEQSIWRVITAPKNTPPHIVKRLEAAFESAAKKPEYLAEAQERGVNPVFMNSAEATEYIEKEYQYYAGKTEEWGIRLGK